MRSRFGSIVALLLAFGAAAHAEVRLVDDAGATLVLAQPARRIVSLAPFITEVLFTAGAGERVVGAIDFSDYPEEAKRIPRVGGLLRLDLERIVQLKPDVVVVWLHGSAQRQLDSLKGLRLPLYYSEPRSLGGIARSVRQFGRLAGTEAVAEDAARALDSKIALMRERYARRSPVRVFFQIWHKPLMTVNDGHVISDVLRLCGGVNVFGQLKPLVPVLEPEAVLAAAPEAIGTGVYAAQGDDGLGQWKRWPRLPAAARGNFFSVPADLITRHGPRLAQAIPIVCEALEQARKRRAP